MHRNRHYFVIREFSDQKKPICLIMHRVAANLENMENLENSGSLKNYQNLRENSGKFEFFVEKPGKLRENVKYVT